ncbi:MAG TPA: PspC domain-containing protein [Caldilineae bacterium]|nr:PspC domain-containing protein [Caldilineae bacterium]
MSGKRLYRSRDDRMIAGVCGGLGEYFNIDPTLVRLALLFLTLWGGGGVLVYILSWIVIPEQPVSAKAPAAQESKQVEEKPAPVVVDEPEAA